MARVRPNPDCIHPARANGPMTPPHRPQRTINSRPSSPRASWTGTHSTTLSQPHRRESTLRIFRAFRQMLPIDALRQSPAGNVADGRGGSRRGPASNDADVSSILPVIPYGGFSSVRLEGWHIRRCLPGASVSLSRLPTFAARRPVCIRPSCISGRYMSACRDPIRQARCQLPGLHHARINPNLAMR